MKWSFQGYISYFATAHIGRDMTSKAGKITQADTWEIRDLHCGRKQYFYGEINYFLNKYIALTVNLILEYLGASTCTALKIKIIVFIKSLELVATYKK